ncbi:MAG TPA: hypothetical protein VIM73_07500 [Polyangiaceae bacterium]
MSLALNVTTEGRDEEPRRREARNAEDDAVRAANRDLEARAGNALNTVVAVLAEQRDRALRSASTVQAQLQAQRDAMAAEQDRFIAFLMADHEKQLGELQKKLAATKAELERRRALEPILPVATNAAVEHASESALRESLAAAERQITSLQELLQAAYAEVDDTRADAARLQEERDDAIRKIEEARVEFATELDAVRTEANELQWQLDAAQRRLEDTRDEAREEAHRLIEEMDEMRRQLDARNLEIWQLRTRLSELDTQLNSQPPPSASSELVSARYEAQLLRKQLIDAKREQARVRDELTGGRTRRMVVSPFPAAEEPEPPESRPSQTYRR